MGQTIHKTVEAWLCTLPVGLQHHIETVKNISKELAHAHDLQQEKVILCATSHDLCRYMTGGELLKKARELNIRIHPMEERIPMLLHGPVAAEILRNHGLDDLAVYEGIYYHSTGHSGSDPISKAVFLADKLDPAKTNQYPFARNLKSKALKDLDSALLEFLTGQIDSFLQKGQLIHPSSIKARNDLILNSTR